MATRYRPDTCECVYVYENGCNWTGDIVAVENVCDAHKHLAKQPKALVKAIQKDQHAKNLGPVA